MRNPENVLNSLQEHSAQSGYVYDRLYRNLYNRELFLQAYQNIYANKGNMTAGVDGQTIDAMSLDRIDKIINTLKEEKYHPNPTLLSDNIGVANGLAWTSVGGEMMQIEVAVLEGNGKLELTGSLGDVMKESAKAAISYIRANSEKLGVESDFYKTKDIHIHVPEGAVPKDGPSAGVTMTTALVSALTNRPVKPDVAMTGEISLRGNVMAIGGLKEKSMAAYKNKMKTVLIPQDNVPDLEKVDEVVKKNIEFIPVSTLDEVLNLALTKPKKSQKDKRKVVEDLIIDKKVDTFLFVE